MRLFVFIISFFTVLSCFCANTFYYDVSMKGDLDVTGDITGTLTGYTANRALEVNGDGDIIVSAVTSTELNYLDGLGGDYISGITSDAQTQFNAKAPLTMTTNGDVLYYNSGYQRLAKGNDGEVLKLSSGLPIWDTDDTSGSIGSLAYSIDGKSSNYTITDGDGLTTITVDSSGGDVTIDLPTVADNGDRVLIVKKIHADNIVTIDGESSETIDGALTYVLRVNDSSVTLQSDASEWHISGGKATVQSSAPAGIRIAGARITLTNATTSSIAQEQGEWLTSVSATGGVTTVTINTGFFSAAPVCTASSETTNPIWCNVEQVSATSFKLTPFDNGGGVNTPAACQVICIGAR